MEDDHEARQSGADDLWRRHFDVVKWFVKVRPSYRQLASEISYALEKRLSIAGIEFSSVSYRAKTLESLLRKLERNDYEYPNSEIHDLAGVRVVHLYRSDFERIREVLEKEFTVIEVVDKVEELGASHFGYSAVHFVVHLGKHSSGPRYDDLRQLRCEIQVRTALQDAWALISHHLVYKREEDIPGPLRRKLNSLSGLFETADDQFDRIRTEREKYVQKAKESFSSRRGEGQTINYDTVTLLLAAELPDLPIERYHGHLSVVLNMVNKERFKSIASLRKLISDTTSARDEFYRKSDVSRKRTAAGALGAALALVDPTSREEGGFQEGDLALLAELGRQMSRSNGDKGT